MPESDKSNAGTANELGIIYSLECYFIEKPIKI